jgi:E3 ubiquitin-protein ligase DOA10
MIPSFRPSLYTGLDNCIICHAELVNSENELVEHEGENGSKHPFHKSCIIQWLEVQAKCPACFCNVNSNMPIFKKVNNFSHDMINSIQQFSLTS